MKRFLRVVKEKLKWAAIMLTQLAISFASGFNKESEGDVMKVLHTADWHIGQFKGPVEDGVNLRSLDTVKCLEYMVEKAREEHPDLVCISGDVFHQEQIGPVRYKRHKDVSRDGGQ